MDFNSIINDVNSKEDFMNFLTQLRLDKQQKSEEWENDEWVDDMEGYFDNMHIEMPTDIDWRFIATLFYAGKIYE